MLVRISVEADGQADHAELASLYRWLQRNAAPDIRLTLVPQSDPEAQGGVFEVINALISDGSGLGGLALSYAAWRQARRSRSKVRFERDGLTVVVEDGSPEAVRRIAETLAGLSTALPDADPGGAGGLDEPPQSSAGPVSAP